MKNNVYPCKPQFYYIKVGFKWVNITVVVHKSGEVILMRSQNMFSWGEGVISREMLEHGFS